MYLKFIIYSQNNPAGSVTTARYRKAMIALKKLKEKKALQAFIACVDVVGDEKDGGYTAVFWNNKNCLRI